MTTIYTIFHCLVVVYAGQNYVRCNQNFPEHPIYFSSAEQCEKFMVDEHFPVGKDKDGSYDQCMKKAVTTWEPAK